MGWRIRGGGCTREGGPRYRAFVVARVKWRSEGAPGPGATSVLIMNANATASRGALRRRLHAGLSVKRCGAQTRARRVLLKDYQGLSG